MPFPTDDRAWNDTLLYLLERRRPGERTLAPDEFADELPFVRPYSQQDGADDAAYAWVVIHKGMTGSVPVEFLRQLTAWSVPVFANEVFVVFSREPGFAMADLSESDHARALLDVLPKREAAPAPEPPAIVAEAPAPVPPPAEPAPIPEPVPTPEPVPPPATAFAPPAAASLRRLRQQQVQHLLRQAVGDLPGQRVLDLACGTGRFGAVFSAATVLGVDAAPDLIEDARAAHVGLPNFRFLVADPAQPGSSEAPFDSVLLVDALPAGPEGAAAMLRAAAAQLRPGGLLFLSLDNSDALHRRLARLSGQTTDGGFTLAEATGMLHAAGFQPLRAEGVLLSVPGAEGVQDDGILDTLRELGRLAGPAHADAIVLVARRG
jgi:SAM-dependent methyltransferase